MAGSRAKLLGESLSCQPLEKDSSVSSHSRVEGWAVHRRGCDISNSQRRIGTLETTTNRRMACESVGMSARDRVKSFGRMLTLNG